MRKSKQEIPNVVSLFQTGGNEPSALLSPPKSSGACCKTACSQTLAIFSDDIHILIFVNCVKFVEDTERKRFLKYVVHTSVNESNELMYLLR